MSHPNDEFRKSRDGTWSARIALEGRNRKWIKLAGCQTEEKARKRMGLLKHLAKRLRKTIPIDERVELLELAGAASSEEQLDAVVGAVDVIIAGETQEVQGSMPTVREFGEAWTSGELHKRWPHYIKLKKTSGGDANRFEKHVYPHVENIRIDEFHIDDAERVLAGIPLERSDSTRRHVAQLLQRLFNMAVYPARYIEESPLPKGFLPRQGKPKTRPFLFPKEEARLLGCTQVELVERMLYGFLAREGGRHSDASRLRWRDFDMENEILSLTFTKDDDPRSWALAQDVVEALKRWKIRFRPQATQSDFIFAASAGRSSSSKRADRFRENLLTAGVTRHELHERSAKRERIWFHDLRATFITLALADGRSETWIMDRTGHNSSTSLRRYDRGARLVQQKKMGWLLPMHECIPELRDDWAGGPHR